MFIIASPSDVLARHGFISFCVAEVVSHNLQNNKIVSYRCLNRHDRTVSISAHAGTMRFTCETMWKGLSGRVVEAVDLKSRAPNRIYKIMFENPSLILINISDVGYVSSHTHSSHVIKF